MATTEYKFKARAMMIAELVAEGLRFSYNISESDLVHLYCIQFLAGKRFYRNTIV